MGEKAPIKKNGGKRNELHLLALTKHKSPKKFWLKKKRGKTRFATHKPSGWGKKWTNVQVTLWAKSRTGPGEPAGRIWDTGKRGCQNWGGTLHRGGKSCRDFQEKQEKIYGGSGGKRRSCMQRGYKMVD